MSSDKTLTCNGTYSTSTTAVSWSQPTLTSNGTLGGSSFAVYSAINATGSSAAWKAFDATNSNSSYAQLRASSSETTTRPNYLIMYNPNALKISRFDFWFYTNNGGARISEATLYGNNTGTNTNNPSSSGWTSIKYFTFTTSDSQGSGKYYININSSAYYKYHKLIVTKASGNDGTGNYYIADINNMTITATYQTSSYNYYWDKTIS